MSPEKRALVQMSSGSLSLIFTENNISRKWLIDLDNKSWPLCDQRLTTDDAKTPPSISHGLFIAIIKLRHKDHHMSKVFRL